MDSSHYEEMVGNLNELLERDVIRNKKIYLFGHCNATEELADLLLERGLAVTAILDNNPAKYGRDYRAIVIVPPQDILHEKPEDTVVCIAARAYAAMKDQLRRMGYGGPIHRLVDYNSYAEYSLSEDTIAAKKRRVERGIALLQGLKGKFPDHFRILCPFSALGDIFIMMSYLPHFLDKRGIGKCVVCVVGNACAQVVQMFGAYPAEIFTQKNMDETIQAVLYTNDNNSFIAHQDRPYVVDIHRALYTKCIPLEQIYCCGVFGLPADTTPCKPTELRQYSGTERIERGNAVLFSPYAKSVTALPDSLWEQIVDSYLQRGYQCFTNVVGDEQPLPGTQPISPKIAELQSLAEYAGTFIGIRSGICDVLKYAKCNKTALYPDYNYCDTRWKSIDMYYLDGWNNIVVKDGFRWEDAMICQN